MRARILGLALVLLAGLAPLAPLAKGAEVEHRLEPGETPESLGIDYFGSEQAGALLRVHNGIGLEEAVGPGKVLRVPLPDEHRAAPGETWASLAKDRLGRAELGPHLAEMNLHPHGAELTPGTPVLIPMTTRYRILPGNTMLRISNRLYGTTGQVDMILRFNGRSDPRRIRSGDRLVVPVVAFGAIPPSGPPDPGAPEPEADDVAEEPAEEAPDVAAPAPSPVREPLRRAVNAYLEGRYDPALEQLEALRGDVLAAGSDQERASLLRHLVYAYVAFDRDERACDSYQALREVEPDLALDPDLVSPRIRDALARCP